MTFNRAAQKAASQRGESIAESLVSLLVVFLAVSMLAGLIIFSYRMILQSRDSLSRYYADNNLLAAQSGESAGKGSVTLLDESGGSVELSTRRITVEYYENAESGSGAAVAYHWAESGTGGGT